MEDARRKRIGARGWLSRAMKACEELARDVRNTEQEEFTEAIENFQKRLATWDETQVSVESLTEVAKLEEEIEAAADFRQTAVAAKTGLLKAWRNASPTVPQEEAARSTTSSASRSVNARLPKLDLPKFSGDVLKFMPFWQQFKACVDQEDMPVVTKYSYLVSLLRGDAKNMLEGLPVTEENYEQAKTLLTARYGRREVVIFAHVQELLAVEIPDATNTAKLSKAYDSLMANVRSLEAQGITADQFGVVLTPIIVSRLPEEIRLEWSRESEGRETDLLYLLKFLEKEIQRRERCRTFGGLESKKDEKSRAKEKQTTPTTAALLSTSGSSCFFCSRKGHPSVKCRHYRKKTVMERKYLALGKSICLRCISSKYNPDHAKTCTKVCSFCKNAHHVTLCYRSSRDGGQENEAGQEQADVETGQHTEPDEPVEQGVAVLSVNQTRRSFLPTAKVKVQKNDGEWSYATLLFDSGADRSYVSESLVKRTRPKFISNASMSFSTFGGRSQGARQSKVYELSLQGNCGPVTQICATMVPAICLPLSRPVLDAGVVDRFDGELADEYNGGELRIDILIGQDLFWSLMKDGIQRQEESSIVAQDSVFGWVLSGNSGQGCNQGITLLNVTQIPDNIVSRFWDLESIGVGEGPSSSVLDDFSGKVAFKKDDGRYEVGLTWKDNHPPLIDNKGVAVSSLCRLEKRLDRDPELKVGYDKAFQEMEDMGFIEEVSREKTDNPVFYLPHHPCVKEESASTKIRPVFNGSCKGPNKVSLNDCLDPGPNLNPNIGDVIMRFRRWKYAVSADVKKAFLQIKLKEEDQDVHRFVLRKDDDFRTMKFVRVAFGVNCSPFLLAATIQHHLSLYPPSFTVSELRENLYVDDFLSGADTEEEMKQLYKEADQIMSQAGMELTKWSSNNSSIMGSCLDTRSSAQYVKVLGISWDRDRDVFKFVGANLPEPIRCTKRVALSLIARIFDPLGFVLPCIISARFLFQDIWRLGIGWDDNLPQELQVAFQKWLQGLKSLTEISIPRSYFLYPWSECEQNIELHAFGDASLRGYGACVYIKYRGIDGTVHCSLVRSCGRVAPIERKTLPRLELLACLVTAQLLDSVIKALDLPGVQYTCWSDSMVALGWIRSSPTRWKQWVANRVSSIQGLTNPERWRHVAGRENPADMVSRGISPEVLSKSQLWWKGPEFLQEADSGLPVPISVPEGNDEVEKERKVKPVMVCVEIQPTFKVERWSTLDKAFKVIALVLRFIKRARKQSRSQEHLGSEEYAEAKEVFLKELQRSEFSREISLLENGSKIPSDSKLAKLNPFLDEKGLLRVRGRIQLSDLSYESKHPIILPKSHGSILLLRFIHTSKNHAGVQAMISAARESYEIFGLRQMAKSVKKSCILCQRFDSRACSVEAAPLPRVRVTMAPVFSVTGIDFAGPLFCSDCPGKKLYICLFVCGVVRAIHLELTESLNTEDFVLAFRRFSALKRVPSIVYSDNGKNLVGGQRVLSTYLGPAAPTWRFNCPRAPWWGGWWERLVRSVKSALKKSIRRECLSRVELTTCLSEIAASINSRPLTFVGTNTDNHVPLSPNHFLAGQGNQGLESSVVEDPENICPETLSLRHQEMVERLDEFWEVWSSDYLKNLPPALQNNRKSESNMQVGSLVLISEEGMSRMSWSVGGVSRLHVGKDGVVRAADIKTAKGTKTRPVQKLHFLELGEGSDLGVGAQESIAEPGSDVNPQRPVRSTRLPTRLQDYVVGN